MGSVVWPRATRPRLLIFHTASVILNPGFSRVKDLAWATEKSAQRVSTQRQILRD